MTRLNSMIRFVAAAVLAVAITTLGVEDTQAADRPGLIVAVNKLPRGLEPAVRTGTVDVRVTYSIFDTLIRRDFQSSKKGNSSKLMPGLATSWKRISPTTVELELRKGVKFHNGDPFTADDVLFTFSKERLRGKKAAIPKGRRYFGNIAKVEKLNDFKVRFIAKKPDLVLEQRLASYTAWIVSKNAYYKFKADGEAAAKAEMEKMKAAKADGAKTAKKKKKKKKSKPHWMNLAIKKLTWNPVGTGPYKFKDWKSGDYVALVANDNYYLGKPAAKSVTFKLVPEVSGRIAGLVSGEYDMVVEIPPDQVPVVKKYKDLQTKSVVLDNSHVIVFNTKHKVLKDKRVRQALSLAIDRQKLIDALWNGETFTPNGHQLPAFGPTYSKERVGYRFDPEAAKKLLKESSYKGETVSYRIIPGYYTNSLEAAQIIQEMWKSIGFKIKLEPVENFKAIRAKGAAIYPWSNTFRYPDPAGAIYVLWGPRSSVQRKYKFWKAPKGFNTAMDQMLNSGNETERKKTFQKSLDIFEDEMPGTLLYNPVSTYGIRKGIEFTPYSLFFMDLRPDNLKITATN